MTVRKFECLNCHHRFEADDQAPEVNCPNCHTDNIDYAHFHLPAGLWKWAAAVVAAVAVVWGLLSIDWKRSEAPVVAEAPVEQADDSTLVALTEPDTLALQETGLQLPATVELQGKLKFEDGGYTFTVVVKNPPAEAFQVAVLDHYDNTKIVARSDNGQFKGVPASDDGKYDLAIVDAATDALLCTPLPKVGFIKQETVTKMSKDELQKLIDSGDTDMGIGENKYLSPELRLHYTGQVSDGPQTLSEVTDNMTFGGWSQVRVASVEYDEMNRISGATLEVTLE